MEARQQRIAAAAIRRMTAALVAFAGPAVLAAAANRGRLAGADRAGFEAVLRSRHPRWTTAAHAVSMLAEPAVIYPALAVAGAVAARRDGWLGAVLPGAVVAGGAVARRRLSRAIARERPPADTWLIEPEGFSLPSKHTTHAALAAGACVRALGLRGTPALAAPAIAAAAVGASRIYLGVHWPADVLAGWLFAEGWLRLTAAD